MTTFGPEIDFYAKNPKNDPFWPPPPTPPIQKSWKMALLAKTGVFKHDLNRKKGGGGGLPRDPPKRPFLAIFAHFGHFWPFLTIFGHFWQIPPILATFWPPECEWKLAKFWPQKGRKPPLARLPISNNRVIRPQIWNLRRKRGFFCTPTGAGNVSDFWPQYPLLFYCKLC